MRLRAWYWVVPAFAALAWTICLAGLGILWAANGHNHFTGSSVVNGETRKKYASSVYISDIGAEHQHFFIGFCVLTSAGYMGTVLIERYLRHQRYIPGSLRKRTTWLDFASLVAAIAGAIGLTLLSIFNTFDHGGFHWSMTALFLVGALLSVLFQTLVLYDLAHSHKVWAGSIKQLLWPATIKLVILILALCVAIAFGCLYMSCSNLKYFENEPLCQRHTSAAAGCEWTIAFLLVPYLLIYCYDFWPAKHDLGAPGFPTNKKPAGVKASKSFGEPFFGDTEYYSTQQAAGEYGFDPQHPSYAAASAAARLASGTDVHPSLVPVSVRQTQPRPAYKGWNETSPFQASPAQMEPFSEDEYRRSWRTALQPDGSPMDKLPSLDGNEDPKEERSDAAYAYALEPELDYFDPRGKYTKDSVHPSIRSGPAPPYSSLSNSYSGNGSSNANTYGSQYNVNNGYPTSSSRRPARQSTQEFQVGDVIPYDSYSLEEQRDAPRSCDVPRDRTRSREQTKRERESRRERERERGPRRDRKPHDTERADTVRERDDDRPTRSVRGDPVRRAQGRDGRAPESRRSRRPDLGSEHPSYRDRTDYGADRGAEYAAESNIEYGDYPAYRDRTDMRSHRSRAAASRLDQTQYYEYPYDY